MKGSIDKRVFKWLKPLLPNAATPTIPRFRDRLDSLSHHPRRCLPLLVVQASYLCGAKKPVSYHGTKPPLLNPPSSRRRMCADTCAITSSRVQPSPYSQTWPRRGTSISYLPPGTPSVGRMVSYSFSPSKR